MQALEKNIMIPQCKKKMYKDITSECTFVNCTHDGGTIFVDEKRHIVFLNVMVTFTVTNGWGICLEIPAKYACAPLIAAQKSSSITATEFWVQPSGDKNVVKGVLTKGKQVSIQGYYMLDDFMEA